MDLATIQERTTKEIERFEKESGTADNNEMLFIYLNRINDEISNLSSSVMAQNGYGSAKNLHESFSDVIFSLSMLAQKMNVHLPTVMQEKIQLLEVHNEI
jgi:NTP pyrophosphatase (non-canonical NTP hydrolase)